ncbi:MAG: mevalonate kinase [Candidatus Helarchaeales archaeon]
MKIEYTCPGKVIIGGEHSVVHGYSCIVSSISLKSRAIVETNLGLGCTLILKNLGKKYHGANMEDLIIKTRDNFPLLGHVHSLLGKPPVVAKNNLKISIVSEIPRSAGLGSSATICTLVIAILSDLLDMEISLEKLLYLGREAEKLFHSNPSGVDTAASMKGGMFLYKKGRIIDEISQEPDMDGYIIIVNTGIPRNTANLVKKVKNNLDRNPGLITDLFEKIEGIVQDEWKIFKEGNVDMEALGRAFDKNQECLEKMGVSIPEIDKVINLGKNAGASGGKLTGAGGGGCVILATRPSFKDRIIKMMRKNKLEAFVVKLGSFGLKKSVQES